MNSKIQRLDTVVIGGGIAGLWVHAMLCARGSKSMLVENRAFGYGQTIASQGIIHGGTKYTLTGRQTSASEAIAAMPNAWNIAMNGESTPSLACAHALSTHQFLCSSTSLASKFTALAASKVMRSRIATVKQADRPPFAGFTPSNGQVYRLNEPILDIPSVLRSLVDQQPVGSMAKVHQAHGWSISDEQSLDDPIRLQLQRDDGIACTVETNAVIVTAGVGNEFVALHDPNHPVAMQRRPLHMVMARDRFTCPVYSHFLGVGATPRATITTHPLSTDDRSVLYIGGQIAEEGNDRSPREQIERAQALLGELLPGFTSESTEWATWRVDRAEPLQSGGRRPDTCMVERRGRMIVAWPTKLALAPRLANDILRELDAMPAISEYRAVEQAALKFDCESDSSLENWPSPTIALTPWEETNEWITAP